jgi:adenylyltransferase/sulfurtransferase
MVEEKTGAGDMFKPVVGSEALSNDELSRYSRQMLMPSVAIEGQEALKKARVLCIGAGGLGSPISLYLAGSGVGTIGIIDPDVVDASNLHRQITHTSERAGMNKAESAKLTMNALNPHVQVETFPFALTASNALETVKDWDIVLDGTDNPASRYLINDTCVILKKPLISGSAIGWDG